MRSYRLPSARFSIGLLVMASMVVVFGAISPAQASNFGTIGNYHSGKCLDDPAFINKNNTQQEIWTCTYHANQLWGVIYRRSDGAVEIQDYVSTTVNGGLSRCASTCSVAVRQTARASSHTDAMHTIVILRSCGTWSLRLSQAGTTSETRRHGPA